MSRSVLLVATTLSCSFLMISALPLSSRAIRPTIRSTGKASGQRPPKSPPTKTRLRKESSGLSGRIFSLRMASLSFL